MVFKVSISANNRVISRDFMAAILVSQNNKTAAMLVSQTNTVGVELFSYANAFFCFKKISIDAGHVSESALYIIRLIDFNDSVFKC